jgi:hypothetical protein
MKISRHNPPSQVWVDAIRHAWRQLCDVQDITPAALWTEIVTECLRDGMSIRRLLDWDKTASTRPVNRIGTIAETIAAGYVPGLRLARNEHGGWIVIEDRTQ